LNRQARAQDSSLLYKDRLVKTGRFTVGIDPDKFSDTLKKDEVQERIRQLNERYKDIKVIVGVDRLDYIKGLTQKLHGFEQFLTDNPRWQGKVVLIQVAVPSREDVKEYQDLETQISCLVGKINGRFSILSLSISVFKDDKANGQANLSTRPSCTCTARSPSRS
jgi:trehalose 6-phosphate synthase